MLSFARRMTALAGVFVLSLSGSVLAATSAHATIPSMVPVSSPALAAWKKTLLTETQMVKLAELNSSTTEVVATTNLVTGYAKLYAGESKKAGEVVLAGSEVDQMPAAGFKAAARAFASNFNYTIDSLSPTTLKAHTIATDGTIIYVYILNVGDYAAMGLYGAYPEAVDASYGYATALKIAKAQKAKIINAGY